MEKEVGTNAGLEAFQFQNFKPLPGLPDWAAGERWVEKPILLPGGDWSGFKSRVACAGNILYYGNIAVWACCPKAKPLTVRTLGGL